MTFGSLLAGIGGLDLGLERAGWRCRWQVEIDPYCRRVLAKHWPDVARYEDVRDVGAHNLEVVDVIAGGFPCQDISSAGKGAGLDGARSGLWREMRRVVRELGPRYVLVENVGALSFRGLGTVTGEWGSLRASAFGAPHQRERLFIVAHAHGERRSRSPFGPHTLRQLEREAPTAFRVPVPPEPPVCGVDDGIPHRVDRLRALGNAVVPQVAEFIARRMARSEPCEDD